MKKYYLHLTILNLLFFSLSSSYGQDQQIQDTVQYNTQSLTDALEPIKKVRKNSILINISNPLLISSKFQMIGYERVLRNNQSFTVNVGVFSIPKFGGSRADSLGLVSSSSDKGFHFSADYRFYLKKENKYAAPRGIYLAPYYTYNYLSRDNAWHLDGTVNEVSTNLKLNIHTIGAELGYQFIFKNRIALDLVLMGPGVGFYGLKTKLDTTLDPEKEKELFDKLNEVLADKIPGYDKIIEPGEFSRKGSFDTQSVGFRYVVRIGYHF